MANGEAFGGGDWIGQLIQQAMQAMMGQIDWSQLMGYGFPGMYEPQAPTREEALLAIWENRADIQKNYRDWWGDPDDPHEESKKYWRPIDAMENWLGITDELTIGDPDEAVTLTPIEFAIEHGFIVDYTSEEAVATLERDKFNESKQQWSDTQLRLAGLDDETIRQFNETMALYRDEFNEGVREADRQYLRQLGLDDAAMERWEREQDHIEAMDAATQALAMREFLLAEGMAAEDIRQFNAEHDFAKYQAEQNQANIQWEQLRLVGLDEQAAYQFQQTHDLAVREYESGDEQWWATFGLEREYFDWEQHTWSAEHELDWAYYGLSEEEIALKRMELMLGHTGPADWPQYWAVSRAMPEAWGPEGEPIPAWAQGLQADQTFPAFGAPGQVPEEIWGGQIPWQVSPEQWAGMSPSEIQGLAGQVQTGGGWMPDWMKNMQAGFPTGQATGMSYFG